MANTEAAGAEKKKRKQADHVFLDAAGVETKDWEKGTGIRYKEVGENGKTFDYQIVGATAGTVQAMLALFGARTLAINTGSQNRQDDASTISDVDAIRDRFDLIKEGDWGAERGGGGGLRIDVDTLVKAMERVFRKDKKPFDETKYRLKITEDEAYRKQAFGNPAIKAAYYAVAAEGGAGTDGLVLE